MLPDIIAVTPLENYQLHLTFDDGTEGTVDLTQLINFEGIFAPLHQPHFFQQVIVSNDLGTICWPNGADLDPVVLYTAIQPQAPIPIIEPPTSTSIYSRDLLPELRRHFGDRIQPELVSARICHHDNYVFLETQSQEDDVEIIHRYNLFRVKLNTPPHQFSPLYSPEQNAQVFLANLDNDYLIAYTVSLLTLEGSEAFSHQTAN